MTSSAGFVIGLPIVDDVAGRAVETGLSLPLTSAKRCDTILLVEDNDSTRDVLRCLEETGSGLIWSSLMSSCHALNGRQALAAIHAEGHPVRYLFMSGYTADIININGKQEKDLNFIAKPVTTAEFLSKIRSIFAAMA